MKINQKTQAAWECEYRNGMHTPRDLYDAGFRLEKSGAAVHFVKKTVRLIMFK